MPPARQTSPAGVGFQDLNENEDFFVDRTKQVGIIAAMKFFSAGWAAFAAQETTPAPVGTVKDQEQQPQPSEPKPKPPSPTPTPLDPSQKGEAEPEIKVSLRDGVHFRSADGNFDILLGGYLGIHWRVFADRPPDNVKTSPDTWYIRQARPELSGFIDKDFDFRLQLDFPTGPAAISGTVQDAYAGWRGIPEFSLRVGQFKEPFGQEQTTPDRFLDFDERSEGDRFTPGRDIGAEVYGTIAGGVFTYELGYFNGSGRAVLDTNKGKEEAGRLRVQPFALAGEGFLFKSLRLGVAGTLSSNQKAPISAFNSNSAYLNISYLNTANVAANTLDGQRSRWGGEVTWNYGPLGLRGEAWRRVDHVDTATLFHHRISSTAWSAQATWLLTGEKKPVEARVMPLHPFDLHGGGWGAVELAARVDRLHIDRDLITTGIAVPGGANEVTGYSAGINWYLTRTIRTSPNFFWEVFNQDIAFADGRRDRHFVGGILRFQLEF
jgi:phosphate-selective porin OprO/OprP